MTMNNRYMLSSVLLSMLLIFGNALCVSAQEFQLELDEGLHPHEEGVQETPELEFPDIEPHFSLGGGYRYFTSKDSKAIPRNEYTFTEGTTVYLLDSGVFRYPDRFTMELQFESKPKDHFADVNYGYRDLFLIRGLNRSLFHNLDNTRITGAGSDVAVPTPGTNPQVPASEEFGIRTMISTVNSRLKAPGYPAHLLVNFEQVLKDGDRQQRWLGGSARFNNRQPGSKERAVDIVTNTAGVGVNSHLGPVEAEYMFTQKNFNAGGDEVLWDTYTGGGGAVRAAGTWEHNQLSDLRGYKHSLKLHTMYTGKMTGSVTLSRAYMENRYSEAERTTDSFGGALTWMPVTQLLITAKYRYRNLDNDNPVSSTTVFDSTGVNSYTNTAVRPSIDNESNTIDLKARWRAASWLTVRGGYTREKVTRDEDRGDFATDWNHLEKSTERDTMELSADTRLWMGLQVKLGGEITKYRDPAYNVQPDLSKTGKVYVAWTPLEFLNTFASYKMTRQERDDLHWGSQVNYPTSPIADDREVETDTFTGGVSLMVTRYLSVSGQYAYFRNDVDQDVTHGFGIGTPAVGYAWTDLNAPWRSSAYVYGGNVNFSLRKTLSFDAGITFVENKARFKYFPSADAGGYTGGDNVGALSKVDQRDTIVTAGSNIELPDNFSVNVRYNYSNFQERAENGFTAFDDGQSHIVMVTLSKTLGKGI